MAVAFYKNYLMHEDENALQELKDIRRLIDGELSLMTGNNPPYGSIARLEYFLGQCYRSLGEFPLAEDHFLNAQRNADLRLKRELGAAKKLTDEQIRTTKIQYEYQFAVICSARVLASSARISMLNGRLHNALRNFYTSRTLLMTSGQAPLKMVVDSHITITELRPTNLGTTAWKNSLHAIDDWYEL